MGASRPTIRDVARRAGVSPSVASRVLAGLDSYAGPRTREAIRHAASELAYQPNAVARHLRAGRTPVVGVLFHRLVAYRMAAPVLAGLEEVLRPAGYGLLVSSTDGPDDEVAAIRLHESQQCAGVVVLSNFWRSPSAHLAQTVARGVPLVAINRWLDEDQPDAAPRAGPVPRVLWDNAAGAGTLTSVLLGLGHRRVAFVRVIPGPGTEPIDLRMNYHQRWQAVRRTAAAAGCPAPRYYTVQEVRDGTWRRDGVTAFIGATDDGSAAADVVHALAQQTLAVPHDASVASFADIELAENLTPRLTTAAIPFEESGRVAARQLLRLVAGEGVGGLVVLPCPVVERESCAPPPAPPGADGATGQRALRAADAPAGTRAPRGRSLSASE
jgi:DNA-binding LacI/PurR family transcriptional regulator